MATVMQVRPGGLPALRLRTVLVSKALAAAVCSPGRRGLVWPPKGKALQAPTVGGRQPPCRVPGRQMAPGERP